MKKDVHYLLNEKQINRYQIISNVIEGNLKPCEAAENLSLSERQICRLIKGVNKQGVSSLIHKNTNKKPSHAIDDASGEIVGLYITKNKCLHGYLEIIRQCVLNHGIPACVYSDRHTIFRSPIADKISVEEQLDGKIINDTQFGRDMKELGIARIFAPPSTS